MAKLEMVARLATVAMLVMGCLPVASMAQQKGQKTFSSAEEASNALYTAAKTNDEKAMLEIFGPDGKRVVSSGDAAEDTESRANFSTKYQEMHRLVTEPDGATTLYIGAENWPTPIPLAHKGNVWYFDTDAGWREILYRRVGRNEMSAIRVCQELVAAEKDYYAAQHNSYAQRIVSDEGQKNGLYWKTANGETQSPIGPLVARASADANAKSVEGGAAPFRGYYFRLLAAPLKNDATGFAFVAYPAEYRSSGVMTFMVDQDGVVWEKDLGKKTETAAKAIKEYNVSSSWHKAEEEQTETAAGTKPQ